MSTPPSPERFWRTFRASDLLETLDRQHLFNELWGAGGLTDTQREAAIDGPDGLSWQLDELIDSLDTDLAVHCAGIELQATPGPDGTTFLRGSRATTELILHRATNELSTAAASAMAGDPAPATLTRLTIAGRGADRAAQLERQMEYVAQLQTAGLFYGLLLAAQRSVDPDPRRPPRVLSADQISGETRQTIARLLDRPSAGTLIDPFDVRPELITLTLR